MDVGLIAISTLATALVGASESFWLNPQNYWYIFQVVMGLGAVIFVHELGHFLVAKACGVRCDKFYVGFDAFDIKLGDRVIIPRRLVHWQWGETEYGIGILPFGGYVKMLGQDDNPGNIEKEIAASQIADESGSESDNETDAAVATAGLIDRSKIDPRSYLAKSVPQRMAIISAGVIFNLIFAVVFAAFAFRSGVEYEPPVIGNVVGGGPAWENDLVGATVKRVGDSEVKEYYTFMDLAQEIVFNGDEKPLRMEIQRYGEEEVMTTELTPKRGFQRAMKDLPLIGVERRQTATIGPPGALEGNAAADADPPLLPGDRIVEINGSKIETDIDIRKTLTRDADKVATFVLERADEDSEETVRVTTAVQPNPMRRFGFSVVWGSISNLKKNSPAVKAGLQVGDEIVSINGQPRGDLLTLDSRMVKAVRNEESVELEIKRDGETRTISIEPVLPNVIPFVGPNQPIAIESLGIAVPLTRTVEAIEPDSGAQQAGLQAGDEIVSVKYVLSDHQASFDRYADLVEDPEVDLVADDVSWAEIHRLFQQLEEGTKIELRVRRDSDIKPIQIASKSSDQYFLHTRGIALGNLQANYKSKSWSDAVYYGAHQVYKDGTRVIKTLGKLIAGKISPTNLGGPGTIAVAATSEASRGTSRLLLFLAFLSANLAVVNLLPIPVLDGGHLLFLAYEGIFRRPVNEKTQILLTYAGLAMILCLMMFVVALDVGRISSLF